MGNKPNMKPGKNELIRRTDILPREVHQSKGVMDYIHRLLTEYIAFEGNEDKFKQHLKEKTDANKEKSGKLRKGSGANSSTGKGKSTTKAKAAKKGKDDTDTTKSDRFKDTGESGNIGL